jgi:cobalt/nickel transport protein
MKILKTNIILIILVIIIGVLPLIFLSGAEFSGADGIAMDAIGEIAPNYKPWFNSVIELPSGEVESLLFALQAAIGAGIVGFILGQMIERHKKTENKNV